jgi:hypothetical protein
MNGGDVVLTWGEPFTGGIGVELLSYTVVIYGGFDDFAEFKHLCDGADPTTFAARECTLSMSDIRDA